MDEKVVTIYILWRRIKIAKVKVFRCVFDDYNLEDFPLDENGELISREGTNLIILTDKAGRDVPVSRKMYHAIRTIVKSLE